MVIRDIALILNGEVIDSIRVAENAPSSFYDELVLLHNAEYYIIVTEETGNAYIGGTWDGTHFYPELDEEYMSINKMFYDPKLNYIMPTEPCPKPGEMYWDMEKQAWFDIEQGI